MWKEKQTETEDRIIGAVDRYLDRVFSAYDRQLSDLEKRVGQLEKKMTNASRSNREASSSIFIVDHMTCDHIHTYNTISQLGIKDLSGQLNIGNAHGEASSDSMPSKEEE
ncbi:hypothetical protein EQV77_15725 [Halobacillus fulvus]|nr:hypothetical protein EQV77_15725 [Halobacillus fulvus]